MRCLQIERWLLLLVIDVVVSQHLDSYDSFGCLSILCKRRNTTKSHDDHLKAAGLSHLELHFRQLTSIPRKILDKNKDTIEILDLSNNRIKSINLGEFPYMLRLHTLLLDYNDLSEVAAGAMDNLPQLQTLSLVSNRLQKMPLFHQQSVLRKIDISWNLVSDISRKDLETHGSLEEMYLQRNKLTIVKEKTFMENRNLKTLDLSQNPLRQMDNDALIGPRNLIKLNLRKTELKELPSKGLAQIRMLDIRDIKALWSIPDVRLFTSLEEIKVTYSVHCCAFQRLEKQNFLFPASFTGCHEYLMHSTISPRSGISKAPSASPSPTQSSAIATTTKQSTRAGLRTTSYTTHSWEKFLGPTFEDHFKGLLDSYRSNSTNPPLCQENGSTKILVHPQRHIQCSPSPDAFNPCDDVMGSVVLRAFCWLIALVAVIGNTLQTIVLYTNTQSMSVYKFLMYHLAIANLIMGVFLLILCSLDAYTYGNYYNYVQSWQYSVGCKVAGFLAIFSSELSICLLAIITLERYLLIVHALNVSHQMRLVHAKVVLLLIYSYAFVIASLPLSGKVSSYSKVAVCLPFDVSDAVSGGYVIWLLSFSATTFVYVSISYFRMYRQVQKSNRGMGRNNDVEVAKRMALIIFSNFACWMPISVSGFVTIYTDLPMNIDTSKFLLVFIFPINACTNPFLYAFFTKIFKEDVMFLLNKMGMCRERVQRAQHSRVPYRRTRSRTRSCECTNNSEISYRATENGKRRGEGKDESTMASCPTKCFEKESFGDLNRGKSVNAAVPGTSRDNVDTKTKKEKRGEFEMSTICHQTSSENKKSAAQSPLRELEEDQRLCYGLSKGNWRVTSLTTSFTDIKDDQEPSSRLRSVSEALSPTNHDVLFPHASLDILSPTTQISNLDIV